MTESQSHPADHIGICIPTFKRPKLLRRLLFAVSRQDTGGLFFYSVHVIDNDPMRSAETTVLECARTASVRITYEVEPIQNIAMARNRALQSAEGNFIAFVDDDEVPGDNWLLTLYLACRQYRVDGVLGPVRPLFGLDAPLWLKESGLCDRPSHESGTVLNHLQTRTGNVLFQRRILDEVPTPFPPEKGRTGGEDIEFFRRMIARGCSFRWCAEAPVFEQVTPDRYKREYYFAKALRIGGLTGEMLRNGGTGRWPAAIQSCCAAVVHMATGTAEFIVRDYSHVQHAVKLAYHVGRICGCLGIVPVRYRPET